MSNSPNNPLQSLLDTRPENDSGFRPEVSQEALNRALQSAGLPAGVPPEHGAFLPALVGDMRDQAAAQSGGLALFALSGSDLPGLIPPGLSDYVVWYFTLPSQMKDAIAELLTATLDCFGNLTGDPWRNAVFLGLVTQTQLSQGYRQDGTKPPSLCFTQEGTSLSRACRQGCVLVVFDCAGALHLRGIPMGENMILGLQGCEGSSFQRPSRIYAWKYLQERTRAVEETGHDPEGPPAGGNHIVTVYSPTQGQGAVRQALPAHVMQRMPRIRWCGIEDAAIGRLRKVTHFLEGAQRDDDRVYLKNTVVREFHDALESEPLGAWVEQVALREDSSKSCYVLVLQVGSQVCVVAMDVADERFQQAYRIWAEKGACPLALENLRNGRIVTREVAWPSDFTGKSAAVGSTHPEARLPGRHLSGDAAVWALVETIGAADGERLVCYSCDAVDEHDWANAS